MYIARCCECKRLFSSLNEQLCTEEVCGHCSSENGLIPSIPSQRASTVEEVIAMAEGNAGDTDGGRLASWMAEWYEEQ